MIFDTHAHYDDSQYDVDRDELIHNMHDSGVDNIVNVGANMEGSRASVLLANKYDMFYASVGVHPEDSGVFTDADIDELEKLCKEKKVVSIGEIGLDYHYPEPSKEIQLECFEKQLLLAQKLNMPVIIHSRDACKDTLDILFKYPALSYNVHCFSYTLETVKELNKLDVYYGIGGVLTFKNGKKLVEAVEYMPKDRVLLETDAPYLAPTPHRGERNQSDYIKLVVTKLSEIWGISEEETCNITTENAKRFYRLV